MTQRREFGEPEGAIWVHGFNMKREILEGINHNLFTCPECSNRFFPNLKMSDLIHKKSHTLSIKINKYKEKYIAIENSKKSKWEQPDYFVHTQYTHTGSEAIHPFGTTGSGGSTSKTEREKEGMGLCPVIQIGITASQTKVHTNTSVSENIMGRTGESTNTKDILDETKEA